MADSENLVLTDGSTWPVPAVDDDEDSGVEWKLRYSNELTTSDRHLAASIVSAYGHLVVEATQAKRDLVAREIRAYLLGRADR